jgi:hypothetical protein
MDQIITLLTNLFNLTKVASVTLPGLLAAGGLALVLWPALPVDLVPVVTAVSTAQSAVVASQAQPSPCPADSSNKPPTAQTSAFPPAFGRACSVTYLPIDDLYDSDRIRTAIQPPQPNELSSEYPGWKEDLAWKSDEVAHLDHVQKYLHDLPVPQRRKQLIFQQFLLDLQSRDLTLCIDLEKSWQGQEEKDVQALSTDAANLEKQRSAAQDDYLAYQKSNSSLQFRYKAAMDSAQCNIVQVRNAMSGKNRDLLERSRRVAELTEAQQVIADRLKDPGRLRPRVGFDAFMTGLVNHVVGFILLSLAAAIVITAIDRAVFIGAFFEDLLDGF